MGSSPIEDGRAVVADGAGAGGAAVITGSAKPNV